MSCFSGVFFSLLVIRKHSKVDNFDELAKTNMKVYSNNNSWVWYQFENVIKHKRVLDNNLAEVEGKMQFIQFEDEV